MARLVRMTAFTFTWPPPDPRMCTMRLILCRPYWMPLDTPADRGYHDSTSNGIVRHGYRRERKAAVGWPVSTCRWNPWHRYSARIRSRPSGEFYCYASVLAEMANQKKPASYLSQIVLPQSAPPDIGACGWSI